MERGWDWEISCSLAFGDGKFIRSKPARFRGERHLFVFFFLSSLLTVEITVEKYHAIHSYSKRSIFMEIFSNLFILVVIRSLIALIDAQSFEK